MRRSLVKASTTAQMFQCKKIPDERGKHRSKIIPFTHTVPFL